MFLLNILECLEIKITTKNNANLIRWTLGNCSNHYGHYNHSLGNEFRNYHQRCCLPPGQYTLTCQNDNYPDGWHGDYIEIQGQRYSEDFLAYKAMRRNIIECNILVIRIILKYYDE